MELRRTDRRVQSVPLVPGRDHGAAGRRAPAVGPAAGGYSVHAAVGTDLGEFPGPDDIVARGHIPADRLFDSQRRGRAAGGRAAATTATPAIRRWFAGARWRRIRTGEEPVGALEEPQCLARIRPPCRWATSPSASAA